jgi:hypothetical protein
MSFLKKMMLVASLLFASSFATAAVYNVDLTTGSDNTIVGVSSAGVFADFFNFTLDQDSILDQDLDYFGAFSVLGFSIVNAGTMNVVGAATTMGGNLSIDNLFLVAGDYTTSVLGVFNGGFGAYALATSVTSVTPVPEASTIAMMLGGLGLVGFMARRRKVA